jgi:hypothetical protein
MQRGLQRLSLVTCFVLGTAIACSMAVEIWPHVDVVSAVEAQGRIRTVIVDPPNSNDPIEIVKVTIAGKASAPRAPRAEDLRWWASGASWYNLSRIAYSLPADDKWIESLSFVLRNRTTEKIARVEITLQLPETNWQYGPEFSFGQFPPAAAYFGDGTPIPQTEEPIAFNPCGEMTFALADNQGGLGRLREVPLQTISQVYARFMVHLEDGLLWTAYHYQEPDPEHRGQWVEAPSPYFPPNGLPGPHMKKPTRAQLSFACSGSSKRGGGLLP